MSDNAWGKYDPRWNDIDANVWNLKDEFTVIDAASLIADIDPSAVSYNKYGQELYPANPTNDTRAQKADATFNVIIKAIENNELKATFPKEEGFIVDDEFPF